MIVRLIYIFLFTISLTGCKEYLDLKPDKKLAIPSTLDDLEALLNNSQNVMNEAEPGLGEIAADDYFLTTQGWESIPGEEERMHYIWEPHSPISGQWFAAYRAISYANTVLDYLDEISYSKSEVNKRSFLKGAALFFKAQYYFKLLQIYSRPYDPDSSNDHPGIVLRHTSDINEVSKRSTLKVCYDNILDDLLEAVTLLPSSTSIATKPSKVAVYGTLARVYLIMNHFEKAKLYADSSLLLYKHVLDYNKINLEAAIPFEKFNKEVVFHSVMMGGYPLLPSRSKVASELSKLYETEDLRKKAFYSLGEDGYLLFKGNYNATNSSSSLFSGITTAEIYLIRAESEIRVGNLVGGQSDLNYLRKHRFTDTKFAPLSFSNREEALKFVLEERRRELAFRGIRWLDLKRLSIEKNSSLETMKRVINNRSYELRPEEIKNYVYLIPDEVIENSNIEQN